MELKKFLANIGLKFHISKSGILLSIILSIVILTFIINIYHYGRDKERYWQLHSYVADVDRKVVAVDYKLTELNNLVALDRTNKNSDVNGNVTKNNVVAVEKEVVNIKTDSALSYIKSLPQIGESIVQNINLDGYPSFFRELYERAELNTLVLPKYAFAKEAETRSRPKGKRIKSVKAEETKSTKTIPNANLEKLWKNYIELSQKSERERKFGSVDELIDAPLNVRQYSPIEVDYGNISGAYTIGIYTWDAIPGFRMPLYIYKPKITDNERVPAVISPPACGEEAWSHNDGTSVQRRMANLALAGMVGLYSEGFCHNGTYKSTDYSFNYSHWAVLTGSSISGNEVEYAIWERTTKLLKSLPYIDSERIGTTGYSHGGNIAATLYVHNQDISAFALVGGISVPSKPVKQQKSYFTMSRYATRYSYPESHSYAIGISGKQESREVATEKKRLHSELNDYWSDAKIDFAARYIAPKPFLVVAGIEDDFVDISNIEQGSSMLREIYTDLNADEMFNLEIVPGDHNFDVRRRGIITRWFAKTFKSNPLVPFEIDSFEHETPIYPKEAFLDIPEDLEKFTLHKYFTESTIAEINAHKNKRVNDPELKLSKDKLINMLGRELLENIPERRVIRLDYGAYLYDNEEIIFDFFSVPLSEYIDAGVSLVYKKTNNQSGFNKTHITINTESALPEPEILLGALKEGNIVVNVIPPGYGAAASSQLNAGNLARAFRNWDSPLLGYAVASVVRTLDFLEENYQVSDISLFSDGIESGIINHFTTALDERIDEAKISQGISSWEEFILSESKPFPAPIMVSKNLLKEVTLKELEELSASRNIVVDTYASKEAIAIFMSR